MGKMELEVKILDINKDEFIDKIKSMGATLKKETKQIFEEHLNIWYDRFEENIPFPKLKITDIKKNECVIDFEENIF